MVVNSTNAAPSAPSANRDVLFSDYSSTTKLRSNLTMTDSSSEYREYRASYDNYARQKRPTAEMEQLIRFVRDHQTIQKETTDMSIKKKAPLPGIGQAPLPGISGAVDKTYTGQNIDNESIRNEYIYEEHGSGLNTNNNLLCESNFIYPADEVDQELDFFLNCKPKMQAFDPCMRSPRTSISSPRTPQSSNSDSSTSSDCFLSQSLNSKLPLTGTQTKRRKSRTYSEPARRPTAMVHQLPPLERQDLPDRPSAPAPSMTPPLPDCDGCFMDGQESPIDYIDTQ